MNAERHRVLKALVFAASELPVPHKDCEQEIALWRAEVWPALKKKRDASVGLLSA